jgi:3-hydroxyacyl-[acyl-carrier-protein] dehydratase
MLLNSLYHIAEIKNENNIIEALITINEEDEIFKGHFSDMPVLPGVCQVEICKELFNHQLQKSLSLSEAASIKFLAFITPNDVKKLNAKIIYAQNTEEFSITASLFSGDKTFLKLQAKLSPEIEQ